MFNMSRVYSSVVLLYSMCSLGIVTPAMVFILLSFQGGIRGMDARDVLDTLNRYWNSKDDDITEKHVKLRDAKRVPPPLWVLGSAQQAWARMKVLPRLLHPLERLQMTHTGLLKIFQLEQKRRPSLKESFDVIMLDEAQDSNDCMADIVLNQAANGCGVILVGDPHQMVYGFRGARDQITRTRSDKTLHLTQVRLKNADVIELRDAWFLAHIAVISFCSLAIVLLSYLKSRSSHYTLTGFFSGLLTRFFLSCPVMSRSIHSVKSPIFSRSPDVIHACVGTPSGVSLWPLHCCRS